MSCVRPLSSIIVIDASARGAVICCLANVRPDIALLSTGSPVDKTGLADGPNDCLNALLYRSCSCRMTCWRVHHVCGTERITRHSASFAGGGEDRLVALDDLQAHAGWHLSVCDPTRW